MRREKATHKKLKNGTGIMTMDEVGAVNILESLLIRTIAHELPLSRLERYRLFSLKLNIDQALDQS